MKREYIESRLQQEREKLGSAGRPVDLPVVVESYTEQDEDISEQDGKHVFRKPPPKRKRTEVESKKTKKVKKEGEDELEEKQGDTNVKSNGLLQKEEKGKSEIEEKKDSTSKKSSQTKLSKPKLLSFDEE
jgi:hypothetical protein